jgi:hypothetical protein
MPHTGMKHHQNGERGPRIRVPRGRRGHTAVVGDPCRLWLGSWLCGEGPSQQAAADDLVDRLTHLARSLPLPDATPAAEHATSPMRLLAALGRKVTTLEHRRVVVLGPLQSS